MKNSLFSIILLLFSCNNNLSQRNIIQFESISFTSRSMKSDYSIKLLNNDSIYYQCRFPEQNKGNYCGTISKTDRIQLDSLLYHFNSVKYDSIYQDNEIMDGEGCLFVLKLEKETKAVYIHGLKAPKDLYVLADWIKKLKQRETLEPTTSAQNYHFAEYNHPPLVPFRGIIKK